MIDQIGRYKILNELGRGAMGVVYKAQDPTIGRMVAIKTIRLGDLAHPEERDQLRSRLFREAQSAGILSHPGIVTIYDIAEEKEIAYIAMEFVEGQTLEKMLDTGMVQDAKYLVSIATQTAVALDYAHTKGIIHRDIKPGNIMVNVDGVVKITDFGIARIASSKFTHTGTVMGTPSYMSPEQVRGAVVDGRSDMFSLSVVLYEMLTGRKPFSGDSITTVIFKIVSESPTSPKELNPSVGNKVNAVVMRALAKEPAERYQNCKEFAEALQLAVEQTANLTPTVRSVVASYAPTMASDPALLTQPEKSEPPAAAPEPPAPAEAPAPAARVETPEATMPSAPRLKPPATAPAAEARPSPPSPSLPPLVHRTPAVVDAMGATAAIAAKPAGEPQAEETAAEKKLPPLEIKHAPPPPAEPTIVKEAPPRRAGLLVGVGAALAIIAAGAYWKLQQKTTLESPTEPAPAASVSAPSAAKPEASAATNKTPTAAAPKTEEPTKPSPLDKGTTASAPPLQPKPGGSAPSGNSRVINITTAEPGARVVLDNDEATACTTPCSIPATAGRRNLLFAQAGYYPERREVIMAKEPVDVNVTMRPVLGNLMLSTTPRGAAITVDGKAVDGETPKSLKLPVGKHVIGVKKDGFEAAERTVDITDDSLIPLSITLQQN